MVYESESQKVLGIQGAGEGEVAKRIDVASQLIARGATVSDFTRIEHAYAPPYAPAIDPLAALAFAAENQEDGIDAISPIANLASSTVLDVRTDEERAERPVAAANVLEIEFEQIADRISELPDEPLTVVCAHGTRSAEVVRRLINSGREACYLGGGMSWRVRTLAKVE
jgi:rhodanese-related sulfurtransferase